MLGFLGLLAVYSIVFVAVQYWFVTLLLAVGVGALLYYRRRRRRAAQERARLEDEALREANRQAWRKLTFEPGTFAVSLTGFDDRWAEGEITSFLIDIPELRDRSFEEIEALVERVVHVAPQAVAEGISQRDAVRLKEALELRGAKAKIKEAVPRRTGAGREAIPAHVRREVWRRDGGRCVDCGLRERLEFDHIIALANGGSNTTRNIELRCESCNRRKGATV